MLHFAKLYNCVKHRPYQHQRDTGKALPCRRDACAQQNQHTVKQRAVASTQHSASNTSTRLCRPAGVVGALRRDLDFKHRRLYTISETMPTSIITARSCGDLSRSVCFYSRAISLIKHERRLHWRVRELVVSNSCVVSMKQYGRLDFKHVRVLKGARPQTRRWRA